MSASFYPMNVSLTTTSADYDVLQNDEVKTQIKSRHNWDESRYQLEVSKGLTGLYFDIFTSNTQVKINDGQYQSLIGNAVYSTDDFLQYPVKTIKIKDDARNIVVSISRL